MINISELHDKFKIINAATNAATNAFIVGKQMDEIGKMMSAIIEARIQNELEQEYKDLNVESQGDLFEDLLKTAKEFDLLDDLALVPEPPKQDIPNIKSIKEIGDKYMRTENIEVTFKIPIPVDKPDLNGVVYSKEAIRNAYKNVKNIPIEIHVMMVGFSLLE